MELRHHPLMSHKGLPNWPPTWTWIGGKENKRPNGEVGILTQVVTSRVEPPNSCFLIIEHEEASYIGCLSFDDHSFCLQICVLLKNYYGRPIQDVGGLDLGGSP